MIEFTIPDTRILYPINIKLLTLINKRPEYFYDDFKITSAYGCPEGCIWNGNRVNIGQYTIPEMRNLFSKYKTFGLGYRLTFSNFLIRPEHLSDTYGNAIAREGELEGNWVISASELMTDYISKNYPKYKILNSVTKFSTDIETVNKESEDKLTVLFVTFNNKFDELKKLKHPENIEVLVNEPCITNCPFKKEHYTSINKYNLFETDDYMVCKFKDDNRYDYHKSFHHIDREKLLKHYELGIKYFKIAGRNAGFAVALDAYLELLVKPQYREIVRMVLLKNNIDEEYNIFNREIF